jgi:hypothetical protein
MFGATLGVRLPTQLKFLISSVIAYGFAALETGGIRR